MTTAVTVTVTIDGCRSTSTRDDAAALLLVACVSLLSTQLTRKVGCRSSFSFLHTCTLQRRSCMCVCLCVWMDSTFLSGHVLLCPKRPACRLTFVRVRTFMCVYRHSHEGTYVRVCMWTYMNFCTQMHVCLVTGARIAPVVSRRLTPRIRACGACTRTRADAHMACGTSPCASCQSEGTKDTTHARM